MKRLVALFLLIQFDAAGLAQRPSVEYEISFPNPADHEARVHVTFRDAPLGPLEVRMSRSSPGRYSLHEFVKNVYGFVAVDGKGIPLPTTRPDPYGWTITDHDGLVRISYTLFADRADGTYAAIDRTHAHLNMPAVFAWARGLEKAPIRIRFKKPDEQWKVSTQLVPSGDSDTFEAPNLAYFMDSPVEISPHQTVEWPVTNPTETFTARLALHHSGTKEEGEAFASMLKPILLEQREVFGEFPQFDHSTYSFIACFLPHTSGDGMEHRNSTIITGPKSLQEDVVELAATAAHEFFHAWNVERMRPRSLEPFDLERANISGELWFAEGFTTYYAYLTMRRARLISLDRYLESLSKILDEVTNSPGREFGSPVEMSQRAALSDRTSFLDPTNEENTYLSYYPFGASVALALDLSLRTLTPSSSLDSYMQVVWREHGRDENPYTLEDLQKLLGQVAGDERFAADFFSRYVRGRELPQFEHLLSAAGLKIRKKHPGKPFLGRSELLFEQSGATISSQPLIGEPLYEAGLSKGDRILRIGETEIRESGDLESLLNHLKPGAVVKIRFAGRDAQRESELTLAQDPALEVVGVESTGDELQDSQDSFRRDWFRSRASPLTTPHRYCFSCRRAFPFEMEYCGFDGDKLRITP